MGCFATKSHLVVTIGKKKRMDVVVNRFQAGPMAMAAMKAPIVGQSIADVECILDLVMKGAVRKRLQPTQLMERIEVVGARGNSVKRDLEAVPPS